MTLRSLMLVATLLGLTAAPARAESKAEFEQRLTQEVTTILDKFLGVGMSQVVVLIDASPALMVPPMEQVGGKPGDKGKDKKDGAQVLWSDYSNRTRRSLMPGFAARQQMVMREDDKPLKAKKEDKEKDLPPGIEPVIMWKIKRMIVTVTLDAGVNDAVSQEVGAMVMDMLGLDPKRGDKLNVYKLPFRSPWRLVFGAPSTWMGLLKWAIILLLIGAGCWFLYKGVPALIAFIRRRKIQVDVNKGEGEEGSEGEGEPAPEGEEPEKTGLLPGLVSALAFGGKANGNGEHKDGEPKKETLALFERVRAFQYVARKNAQLLGEVLSKDEDVQLAVVTSFLDPSLGGLVLKQLDPEKRRRVLEIMSKASHVMPDYLKKLEKEVELRLKHAIGGTELVADLVSQLDPQEQSEIVQSLWQKDQLLARKVHGMIFRFEDLFHLPERDLRILVEAVQVQDWVSAMQGMQPAFKQALVRVLPEERRRVFEQHLDMGVSGGKESAESMRWKILKTAKELHVQGRIALQKPQNGHGTQGHDAANGAAPAAQPGQFYHANNGSGAAAGRR